MKVINIIMIMIFCLFLCILYIFSIIYFSESYNLENIPRALVIENHVKLNNLSMPFPNTPQFIGNEKNINNTMNLNFNEFSDLLKQNYIYSYNEYDCKYWAYVWSNYWKFNHKKYDWDLYIMMNDNHVFIIVQNSTEYCVLDQNITKCIGLG